MKIEKISRKYKCNRHRCSELSTHKHTISRHYKRVALPNEAFFDIHVIFKDFNQNVDGNETK